MLDVIKRAGENLLDASDKINAILKEDHGTVLPADLNISLTGDQSDQTRVSVDELMNHIVLGVMLVVGTLMLFLGLRNARVRGPGDPHEHVHLLHLAQRVRGDAEHDGALRPHPGLGPLGGRRHRDRGEHLPPHDQRRTVHEGHAPGRGRGDHADHRRHHRHRDGVRAPALLARHDG
jgi:hypothetical protein